MRLPYGLGSYQRASERLPQFRLINLFAEQTPADAGGVVLLQRPGLALWSDDFTGDCRGFYKQSGVLGGDLLSVFGSALYRGTVKLGGLPGTDQVQWAYTVDGLRVLSGGVIYRVTATTITADSFPDSAPVQSISSVNDILVAVRRDTQRLYYRLPGDASWNALDFTSASAEPDDLIGVVEMRGEVWAFGRSSVEVFYTTDLTTQPLQRADGRQIDRGCKDRDSIAKLDNTLFWVGEDNNVYRYQDVPVIVSDPGISERVSASATAKAWTYALDGHLFYVVSLDDECLAYDAATSRWHQLRRYGQTGFVTTGIFDGSTTYMGGPGKVWTFDASLGIDEGSVVIERLFTSAAPVEAPMIANALDVLVSPGTSPLGDPAFVETRWSRDQGRTWTDWLSAPLGVEGAYRTRARIRRLGMIDAPGTVFEHRVTDQSIVRFSGVDLNPTTGGRSRP